MENDIPIANNLKNKFLELFPGAEPGSNGNINLFTDPMKEYHSITKGVGIRCLSGNLILKLTGKDVQDFIHRISTNDVKNLGVFKQTNTLFTTEKGRLIDRTTFLKIGDYYLLVGSKDEDKKLLTWLDKYLIMEEIEIEDVSENYTIFEFYGSQVNSFMTMMCGDKCSELDGEKITIGDTDSIKTYFTKLNEVNNITKFAAVVSHEQAIEFVDYLNNHRSAFDLHFIGDKVFNHFKIVHGIPGYPNEINADYNPHEVNLIDEVNFAKGCYIGQEVIARLDTYDKVQRFLKGVKFDSHSEFSVPVDIVNEKNEVVGELTSKSNLELSEAAIGLALIRRKSLEKEEKYFVNNGEKVELEVTDLPIEE